MIALDLPGFGESDKPIAAAYDAPYFARSVTGLMDALEIDSAHIVGNSLGGRVAIEMGLLDRERVRSLVLLSPALAWLRDRRLEMAPAASAAEAGVDPAHSPLRHRADRAAADPGRQ